MCCAPLVTAGDGDEQQHVYMRFYITVDRLTKDCLEKRGPLAVGQKPWKNSFEKKVSVSTDIQISKIQPRANFC